MTLYRRNKEYGISSAINNISDSELDTRLRGIRKELPYSGETKYEVLCPTQTCQGKFAKN